MLYRVIIDGRKKGDVFIDDDTLLDKLRPGQLFVMKTILGMGFVLVSIARTEEGVDMHVKRLYFEHILN